VVILYIPEMDFGAENSTLGIITSDEGELLCQRLQCLEEILH